VPSREKLRYHCCGKRFDRIVRQGVFPADGCPVCGELPEDYETIAQWRENRPRGPRTYTYRKEE
jgi:hypothetical protein